MKILLAIDLSVFSREALRTVIAQFQRKGSKVLVLHVLEPSAAYLSADLIPHLVEHVAAVEADRRKNAQQLVRHAAEQLRKAGFQASEAVEDGSPKAIIIEKARTWGADVIVMGSHGLSGLSLLLMGSVSDAVSRHAGCSVEIVRRRGGSVPKR